MTSATASASGQVLIVDDNVALAENIAEALAFDGISAAVASTAEEALPLLLSGEVAVLVTDYRLPGINGAELIRRVLSARQDVRCLVISAYTDDDTINSAAAAGARFLAKPLDLTRLSLFVRDLEGTA